MPKLEPIYMIVNHPKKNVLNAPDYFICMNKDSKKLKNQHSFLISQSAIMSFRHEELILGTVKKRVKDN